MRIDPAGWPFVGLGLGAAALVAVLAGSGWGVAALVLPAFFLFFFRDPERDVQAAPDEVVSPADGRVMVAGEATGRFATGGWQQITIFLSPMDVHVNRMPVAGRVTSVKYQPGRFLPAYRPDAGDLNEHTEVTLERGGQTIVVRQIVGVLARRIVCRVREGDMVDAGGRFGVMKFGSRMDVFLPTGSTIRVKVGDRVLAGVTIIATLPPALASSGASRP
jgi:phosphatidylserine decarboxylase